MNAEVAKAELRRGNTREALRANSVRVAVIDELTGESARKGAVRLGSFVRITFAFLIHSHASSDVPAEQQQQKRIEKRTLEE
jgi:hypothetical protein